MYNGYKEKSKKKKYNHQVNMWQIKSILKHYYKIS